MSTAQIISESTEGDGNTTGNETYRGLQESAAANTLFFGQVMRPWEILRSINSLTGYASY